MLRWILVSLMLLALPAISQESKGIPPRMDSVTIAWDDALSGHTATLRWSEQLPEPPGVKVNRYRVWRSLTADGLFKRKGATSKGITTYIDVNVVSGRTYWYYVTALDTAGVQSDPSITVAATIP